MKIIDILRKQGGVSLIKQYWKGGALPTAIGEFVLLGKSRTALEILRNASTLKIKQKLEKKYKKYLEIFDSKWVEKEHVISNKVWICWLQGMEQAPELVRKCYASIKENLIDSEIILITSDNMTEYVKFPDFIIEKWKKGIITNTHLTDLLRLELLINHGGMWIDSTVFCSTQDIPSYFMSSDLFFFQCLKPGRDGHSSYISSWLMSAKTNNKILMATRDLIYEYWKNNNSMWDYFLLHDFISIVLDKYPDEWGKVVPRDNATPHILLLRLFDEYDEQMWNNIKIQTPFHKLTYKFSDDKKEMDNTYYSHLFK